MTAELDNYRDQKSCQELDDHRIHVKILKDFDQNSGGNNSDDYEILQELDDHGTLPKFSSNFIRILQLVRPIF